jgi:predicted nucleic acid-binding Zn ribbon protein
MEQRKKEVHGTERFGDRGKDCGMKARESIASLGSVLDALVRSLGIEKQVEQYKIFDAWNDIVGEQVAKVAKPARIHNNTLIVTVSNAPWRAELTFRKREILTKIHERLNSKSITDITFR